MLRVSTFCSGIGSPEVALKNLSIEHEIVLTAEIDKYARQTYLANHSTKKMINDMTVPDYEGEEWYSDINISGLPCQSFSLAGKRLGELDPRGLLFFDFYRYVKNQNPKYFIIENVKGLLSDNDGNTFQNWINLLGQSVNGDTFMFPHEDSLMYNLHWQVLNTKDYGLPQNRERVFLIGIRNDLPNTFVFPKKIPLELRLKDVLEDEVDEKYYLSNGIIDNITGKNIEKLEGAIISNQGKRVDCLTDVASTLMARDYKGFGNQGMTGVLVNSATASGYETATEGDCCNQGVMVVGFERTQEAKEKRSKSIKEKGIDTGNFSDRQLKLKDQDYSDTILANPNHQKEGLIAEFKIGAMRGRNPENPSDRTTGAPTQQMLEINENGTSNCLTSVQKDNLVIQINPSTESGGVQPYQQNRIYDSEGIAPALCRGKSDLNITEIIQLNNPTHSNDRIYSDDGISLTLNTMQGGNRQPFIATEIKVIGSTGGANDHNSRIYSTDGISPTILAGNNGGGQSPVKHLTHDYRIRKLTPLECFRLQGFPDEFLQKAIDAGVSNSQLYKQAGNSITTNVIQAILKNLLT